MPAGEDQACYMQERDCKRNVDIKHMIEIKHRRAAQIMHSKRLQYYNSIMNIHIFPYMSHYMVEFKVTGKQDAISKGAWVDNTRAACHQICLKAIDANKLAASDRVEWKKSVDGLSESDEASSRHQVSKT